VSAAVLNMVIHAGPCGNSNNWFVLNVSFSVGPFGVYSSMVRLECIRGWSVWSARAERGRARRRARVVIRLQSSVFA